MLALSIVCRWATLRIRAILTQNVNVKRHSAGICLISANSLDANCILRASVYINCLSYVTESLSDSLISMTKQSAYTPRIMINAKCLFIGVDSHKALIYVFLFNIIVLRCTTHSWHNLAKLILKTLTQIVMQILLDWSHRVTCNKLTPGREKTDRAYASHCFILLQFHSKTIRFINFLEFFLC